MDGTSGGRHSVRGWTPADARSGLARDFPPGDMELHYNGRAPTPGLSLKERRGCRFGRSLSEWEAGGGGLNTQRKASTGGEVGGCFLCLRTAEAMPEVSGRPPWGPQTTPNGRPQCHLRPVCVSLQEWPTQDFVFSQYVRTDLFPYDHKQVEDSAAATPTFFSYDVGNDSLPPTTISAGCLC